jgi:hypothetical protein
MYFLQIRGLWLKQNGQPNLGINRQTNLNQDSKIEIVFCHPDKGGILKKQMLPSSA